MAKAISDAPDAKNMHELFPASAGGALGGRASRHKSTQQAMSQHWEGVWAPH